MAILIFIIILAILVLIHEFGHFIAAKKAGVKVEEFGFGFPPRLFGIKKGETLYSINLLPLGGFVKLYGEEYHEAKGRSKDGNRAFVNKKPWQKAVIIVAGVIMNLVLGVGLYYFILATNNFRSEPLPLLNNYDFTFGQQETQIIVGSVTPNSPAEKAGIESGDIVASVKIPTADVGTAMTISSSEELIKFMNTAQGKEVLLQLTNINTGVQRTVKVVPLYDDKLKRAIIGIGLVDGAVLKYQKPPEKILSGFLHSYNVTAYNFSVLGSLMQTSIEEKSIAPISETTSGPIGIYAIVDSVLKTSGEKLVMNLLNLIALLSLSLAVINIFPFPALDGGRLIFIVYEWIAKKPANKNVEKYFNLIGMVFLLTLALLISISDVIKILR